jgi:hypothetical protein
MQNGKHGLTQLLLDIPLHPGDQRPTVSAIYSDAEDKCVADKIEPEASPSVVILADGNMESSIFRHNGLQFDSENTPVVIVYCERDTPIIPARQRAGYVTSAIVQSLAALSHPRLAQSARRFGSVELLKFEKITAVRASGKLGTANMIAAVLATAHARFVPSSPVN